MAINTAQLKKKLGEIFADLDEEKSPQDKADEIAEALETWIKTASVQVTALSGQIQVVGSPSAQANANPISISGEPSAMTGGIT